MYCEAALLISHHQVLKVQEVLEMVRLASAILVLSLALSGCAPPGLPPSEQQPVVDSFDADPLTVSAGEAATLTWTVSDARTVEIDGGIGSVALSGSRLVSPTETTIYTLTATGSAGKTVTATTQVRVQATAATPIVIAFSANPPVLSPGASVTLTWESSGATSASISPGVGSVATSGSTSVWPTTDTTYTLTATSAAGSASATAHVVVSTAAPSGPPVINIFVADPPTIHPGESTTLRWDVSEAGKVSLDRGIGSVPPVGTRIVSVLATTNYTLTASNSEGTVSLVIPVLVTPVPDEAEPDLIITSIEKVATSTGYLIGYTIKNQGAVHSGPSTSKLYVEGIYTASDSVSALMPGQSLSRQFVASSYDPSKTVITVVADANDDVSEANEGNNEKTVSLTTETVLDLVDKASLAQWTSGTPATPIGFGGSASDPKGFAAHQANIRLEDNVRYSRVLETHPKWVDGGWIYGFYPEVTVPSGARLVADVGFLSGASESDGVIFRIHFWRTGSTMPEVLGSINAKYDGHLDHFDIDLSGLVGKKGKIGLEVLAGTSADQDWAAWANVKVLR